MRKILCISILLLGCFTVFSQSGLFKNYSIEEGLSQSQVNCIYQDKEGYLWFGTDGGGVCRFDGKQFTTYTTSEGLSDNVLNAIIEDSVGNIWLGTYKGLSIINGPHFLPLPEPLLELQNLQLRSICRDGNGKYWFGTEKGAYQYDGKKLIKIPDLDGKIINVIFEDLKGNIWFGTTGDGVIRLKGWMFTVFNEEHGLPDNTVNAIIQDKNGNLLFGTDEGISRFSGYKFTPFGPVIKSEKRSIKSLLEDRNGNIWAATTGSGLLKISGPDYTLFTTKQGLSNDRIMAVFEDREGNIWVGTEGGGVLKYSSAIFSAMTEKEGLMANLVLSILEDGNGNMWFGTDKGVSMYDGNSFTHYNETNGMASEEVWAMIEDRNGNIWMSTYGRGVYKYNGTSFINYNENKGLSSNNVRSVFEDSKGNIWIGTAKGLNKFDGERFTIYTEDDGMASHRILAAMEDRSGNMWFACSGGGLSKLAQDEMNIMGGAKFVNYTEEEGLSHNVVLSIAEDNDGYIWCANYGGISRINPLSGKQDVIANITKKDGLTSNTVYLIVFDDNGNLLIGTNNGIDKLDVSKYNETGKVILTHYGKEEGFSGIECNTNSRYKDRQGNIWFGTIEGAVKYNPNEDRINKVAPITHITDISLFFEKFDWTDCSRSTSHSGLPVGMKLPHDHNHLTFDYIGLSFVIPEKVRYAVILEGFDKSWSPVTDKSFTTYSNLPPGSYSFKVKASNNDGVWNEEPTTLNFVILPPFWKTLWFQGLYVIAFLLAVYLFIRYRLTRLRKAERNLKEQVQIKTRELREEKELVESQNKEIEKHNKDITASIRYAKRIQEAVMPVKENIKELLPESFIFFKPRDIVSGDFYWFHQKPHSGSVKAVEEPVFVTAVDCTGHGVPGAFMSLIGNELLNDVVVKEGVTDPSEILQKLHQGVVTILKKDALDDRSGDGMDIALCTINLKSNLVEFAGSGRPLILIRNGKVKTFRSSSYPLGIVMKKQPDFTTQSIQLQQGDCIYIFTDGYCDQFGGQEDDKFMMSRFQELLLRIHKQDMAQQEATLGETIMQWKGNNRQLDDMLVIGVRV